MTQPLDKSKLTELKAPIPLIETDEQWSQRLYREEWLKRLHLEAGRQCTGQMRPSYAAGTHRVCWKVCVMALLGEVTHGPGWFNNPKHEARTTFSIGAMAGLSPDQVRELVARNDGSYNLRYRPHTFRQLKQIIEAWFP